MFSVCTVLKQINEIPKSKSSKNQKRKISVVEWSLKKPYQEFEIKFVDLKGSQIFLSMINLETFLKKAQPPTHFQHILNCCTFSTGDKSLIVRHRQHILEGKVLRGKGIPIRTISTPSQYHIISREREKKQLWNKYNISLNESEEEEQLWNCLKWYYKQMYE